METEGGGQRRLLIGAGEASIAGTVADTLETAGDAIVAEPVGSGAALLRRATTATIDGVVLDGSVDGPEAVVARLTAVTTAPVVLLADAAEPVTAAVETGVADVFPRATGHSISAAAHIVQALVQASQRAAGNEKREDATGDEQAYREVFENVSDGLVVHDPDTGEIRDVNRRYCALTGYSRAGLIGSDIRAIVPDDPEYTVEQAVARIEQAREAGPQLFEFKGERKDGDTFIAEVNLTTVTLDGSEQVLASVRDISERAEQERELAEQRRLYETLVEQSPNGVVIVQDREVKFVNPQMTTLTGWSADELQSRPLLEIIAPEDRDLVERRYEQRTRGENPPQNYEITILTADEERRNIDLHVSRIDYRGAPATLATFNDVTELRRREEELRESERRFRTIAERVEEIIYLANADLTEVEYVNAAYADIYGRPVAELDEDPRAFLEAVHPEDRDDYEADLEAMLADIEAGDPDDRYEFDFRIKRPDGEARWLEATGYPILDATDQPDQFVGVVTDVTERHRREQTLETFHEATRELTAADSRQAACERAVDAATDVLGFPFVAAYLYDEETGVLEPAAVSPQLETRAGSVPAFEPGETLPWQVFVDGEAVTNAELTTEVYGPGVPAPDIVLPLGAHGVMLVGAPTTFDAEAVELAQILAATVEAALNHVAGERALTEREAELQRQQERADQLERLNTIIRDIEQTTVEETSRAGIEEAVCARLVDVDRHDLVWIGEPTVGEDGLVARTSAGSPDSYVDGLASIIGPDGAQAGGHPAVAAYQTDEPHSVDNIATEITGRDWRSHALGHGIQSVVAVPIQYETTTHGVLVVASTTPEAFDEATREVLAELGQSIGYAITVTEREQALESAGTTELEFTTDDEGLFMIRGAAGGDCRVTLERTIRRTGGAFSMFYSIEGADPEAVVELANAAPSVEAAQVVSADETGQSGLIEVTAPTWFGSVFTEHGAVVREATAEPDGGRLVVETPRGTDVRGLVEGFQDRYPDTTLTAQRQRERTIRSLFELQDTLQTALTDRQWEALETAYSAGYFAWPRDTSGQEVADLLGVSQPTFNKHLRIAEQTAFQMLLDHEYEERGQS
ncbi:PAS domain S-box protein [Halosegnis sp.]|uniref:PAS domain S-box protein n=1 Tax=Halosegnis sp. TaxID=2864959 RepID=UPI0035D4718F